MSGSSDAVPGGEPDAALAELGRAITRAANALTALPSDDDATAYRCARSLDAALADLAELLRTVPGIAALGDPGSAVSKRLEHGRAELATRREDVRAYRAKLDDLAETERNLAELTAEASRLRERVSDLERVQRLAGEIPGLRIQVQVLEEAVAVAGVADAPEIGAQIAAAARQFAALTGRQREAIGAEADTIVADAEQAARELDQQRARRDAALADLAEGLRAAGFGTGLSALETVTTELTGIRQRLTDLDNALRPLLADHAEAHEKARQARPL
jgi:chromosome segregation ATPase